MADLGDVIELTVDLPQDQLRAGTRGAIVHCYEDGAYEVEIADANGETIELLPLRREQFIVVWRAETRQPVPVWERVGDLLRMLPEDSGQAVLDFARFLAVHQRGVGAATSAGRG